MSINESNDPMYGDNDIDNDDEDDEGNTIVEETAVDSIIDTSDPFIMRLQEILKENYLPGSIEYRLQQGLRYKVFEKKGIKTAAALANVSRKTLAGCIRRLQSGGQLLARLGRPPILDLTSIQELKELSKDENGSVSHETILQIIHDKLDEKNSTLMKREKVSRKTEHRYLQALTGEKPVYNRDEDINKTRFQSLIDLNHAIVNTSIYQISLQGCCDESAPISELMYTTNLLVFGLSDDASVPPYLYSPYDTPSNSTNLIHYKYVYVYLTFNAAGKVVHTLMKIIESSANIPQYYKVYPNLSIWIFPSLSASTTLKQIAVMYTDFILPAVYIDSELTSNALKSNINSAEYIRKLIIIDDITSLDMQSEVCLPIYESIKNNNFELIVNGFPIVPNTSSLPNSKCSNMSKLLQLLVNQCPYPQIGPDRINPLGFNYRPTSQYPYNYNNPYYSNQNSHIQPTVYTTPGMLNFTKNVIFAVNNSYDILTKQIYNNFFTSFENYLVDLNYRTNCFKTVWTLSGYLPYNKIALLHMNSNQYFHVSNQQNTGLNSSNDFNVFISTAVANANAQLNSSLSIGSPLWKRLINNHKDYDVIYELIDRYIENIRLGKSIYSEFELYQYLLDKFINLSKLPSSQYIHAMYDGINHSSLDKDDGTTDIANNPSINKYILWLNYDKYLSYERNRLNHILNDSDKSRSLGDKNKFSASGSMKPNKKRKDNNYTYDSATGTKRILHQCTNPACPRSEIYTSTHTADVYSYSHWTFCENANCKKAFCYEPLCQALSVGHASICNMNRFNRENINNNVATSNINSIVTSSSSNIPSGPSPNYLQDTMSNSSNIQGSNSYNNILNIRMNGSP